jgi:hypothetical protein
LSVTEANLQNKIEISTHLTETRKELPSGTGVDITTVLPKVWKVGSGKMCLLNVGN